MKNKVLALAGLALASSAPLSAQTTPPDGAECFAGTPVRWNDDRNGNVSVDVKFSNGTDEFAGTFEIDYTGEAPVQTIGGSPDSIDFTFDPAVTSVSLPGITVPDTFSNGDQELLLCHTCYDFNFSFADSADEERFKVQVFSGEREIVATEKGFFDNLTSSEDAPLEFVVTDLSGERIDTNSTSINVSISNIQACYCAVPEPSTASLGILALGALAFRRKR